MLIVLNSLNYQNTLYACMHACVNTCWAHVPANKSNHTLICACVPGTSSFAATGERE